MNQYFNNELIGSYENDDFCIVIDNWYKTTFWVISWAKLG